MPPELKNNDENNKEELAKSLHKDSPLPQLRTYQGDVAKFIQTKDQSAVSIALKEKEAREKKEKEKWLKNQREEEEKKKKEAAKRKEEMREQEERDKKRRTEEEAARRAAEKERIEAEAQLAEQEKDQELREARERMLQQEREEQERIEMEEARQAQIEMEQQRREEAAKIEEEARERAARAASSNPAVDDLARELEEQMAIQKAKEEAEAKTKQEQVEQLTKVAVEEEKPVRTSHFSSMITVVLSLFLLAGSIVVGGYAFLWRDIDGPIVEENYGPLIRPDEKVVVEASGVNPGVLREAVLSAKKATEEGKITEISVTDSSNQRETTLAELIIKLNLDMPNALVRSLGEDYILGVYGEKSGGSLFLIFREKDYGIAFRDMLEWEGTLYSNFQPLFGSGTAVSSPAFKDYILSNKDTRAVLASANKVQLLYTFLDKNTILITETGTSLRGLLDAYATRNLVR